MTARTLFKVTLLGMMAGFLFATLFTGFILDVLLTGFAVGCIFVFAKV